MNLLIRIKDCLDNHEAYIATMATMPDKELAKKLEPGTHTNGNS